MGSAGFESAIPAIEWPKTYALDLRAFGISKQLFIISNKFGFINAFCLHTGCSLDTVTLARYVTYSFESRYVVKCSGDDNDDNDNDGE